jgi:hypothetical protein
MQLTLKNTPSRCHFDKAVRRFWSVIVFNLLIGCTKHKNEGSNVKVRYSIQI